MSVYVHRKMEKVENRYLKRKKKDFYSVERKITLVHVGFYAFNFIGKSSFVFNLLQILLGAPYRRGFISDIKLT